MNSQLHALRRIRRYLTLDKAKQLCFASVNVHFNDATMMWVFANELFECV